MSRPTFPPLEDDFTRALLRSAEGDEPSSAAYAKAAATLGVGAGLGVSASLAAPAVLAGAGGVARWAGALAVRPWAFGVSGAVLVGGGALLLRGAAPAAPPALSTPQNLALPSVNPGAVPARAAAASALPAVPLARPAAQALAVSPSTSASPLAGAA